MRTRTPSLGSDPFWPPALGGSARDRSGSVGTRGVESPGKNGLLHMQPVLGFVPHHRLRAVDHLRRDLVAAVGRKAMHADGVRLVACHHGAIDLERLQEALALLLVFAVSHGHPDI